MPENQKTLKRRIRSIKTTRQVTRAMEMVSAAKLRRAGATLSSARPYAAKLREMLEHLSESPEAAGHPLFAQRSASGRSLVVLFTSDRGLCGSFNATLIRQAELAARERNGAVYYYCVGRKGHDHLRRVGASIVGRAPDMAGRVEAAGARQLSADLTRLYNENGYDAILLVFAHFISNSQNRPVVETFLPVRLEPAEGDDHTSGPYKAQVAYLLEPSPADIFTQLVPQYLYSRIFITLAETMTSEHSARMIAMNNATANCEELADQLTLKMNKARQASITKEILEIVSGAEALKG